MIFWASGIQQEVGAPLPWGGSIPSGQILHVQFRSVCKFGIMLAWIPFGAQALWRNMEFLDYSLMAAVREKSNFYPSVREKPRKSLTNRTLSHSFGLTRLLRGEIEKFEPLGQVCVNLGNSSIPKWSWHWSVWCSPLQDTSHLFKK